MTELSLEHIDPKRGTLVSGLCNEFNEVLANANYNIRKSNRFVPYRVCEHPTPVTFGDIGEFLIGGDWVVCEFGGLEWWDQSSKNGCAQVEGGKTSSSIVNSENVVKMNSHPNTVSNRKRMGEKTGPLNAKKMNSHPNTIESRRKNKEENAKKMNSHPNTKANAKRNGHLYGAQGASITNKQRWMCTQTGHVSNPGNLTRYQKHRGIVTSLRVRLED